MIDDSIFPTDAPEQQQEASVNVKVLKPEAIVLEAADQVLFFESIMTQPIVKTTSLRAFSCLFIVDNRLATRS